MRHTTRKCCSSASQFRGVEGNQHLLHFPGPSHAIDLIARQPSRAFHEDSRSFFSRLRCGRHPYASSFELLKRKTDLKATQHQVLIVRLLCGVCSSVHACVNRGTHLPWSEILICTSSLPVDIVARISGGEIACRCR